MGHFHRGGERPFSLRLNLGLLVSACVLPAALVSAALLYANFKLERANIEHQTALVANTVLADLEREVAAMESALKTLATSEELTTGDLAGFHARARLALSSGIVYNYLLIDAQGHQVLNTLQPYGQPLPTTGTPAQLASVFSRQTTVLTDLFTGPVTSKPAIAMGVPVVVDGRVRYNLSMGLSPDRLNDIVARHPLPEGWLLAVLDSGGTIVARSFDAAKFLGQKAVPELRAAVARGGSGTLETVTKEGTPVFTAYAWSRTWNWSVAVGASKALLQESMVARLWQVGAGLLLAMGLGLWFARSVVLKVLSSVTGLNQAALALVNGEPVVLPRIHLTEAEAVGDAILQAADVMQRVKFMAHHDALTGLPNRLLFEDFALRRLALAQRQELPFALLAIDLDGFKAVNDTLGHAAGDQVLIEAARRLQAAVRASDLVARMGGDEFMVLLYDVEADTAMATARHIVSLLSDPYADVGLPVSASVGVAMCSGGHDSLQALTGLADQALYEAKERGKHQAVLAEDLPPTPTPTPTAR